MGTGVSPRIRPALLTNRPTYRRSPPSPLPETVYRRAEPKDYTVDREEFRRVPALRDVLLGDPAERNLELLAAVAVFVGTFVAYAVGAFTVDGGVIMLPQDATYVGTLVAAGIGYRRGSLLGAWVSPFAAYLGFDAERAFLGLPSHSLAGKLEFLLGPEGVVISAAASILFGSVAYAVGYLVGIGLERARGAKV